MAASDYAPRNPEVFPCPEGGVHRWKARHAIGKTRLIGLCLVILFLCPLLVSGCVLGWPNGVPWYLARRHPTGLTPDPTTNPEPVIQVYAARAVSWRGVFAVHTWIAVKPAGAAHYSRYEVLGFGVVNGVTGGACRPDGPRQFTGSARGRGWCSTAAGRGSTR